MAFLFFHAILCDTPKKSRGKKIDHSTTLKMFFFIKVVWYPQYIPKSLFKYGEERLIVCYSKHPHIRTHNFRGQTDCVLIYRMLSEKSASGCS